MISCPRTPSLAAAVPTFITYRSAFAAPVWASLAAQPRASALCGAPIARARSIAPSNRTRLRCCAGADPPNRPTNPVADIGVGEVVESAIDKVLEISEGDGGSADAAGIGVDCTTAAQVGEEAVELEFRGEAEMQAAVEDAGGAIGGEDDDMSGSVHGDVEAVAVAATEAAAEVSRGDGSGGLGDGKDGGYWGNYGEDGESEDYGEGEGEGDTSPGVQGKLGDKARAAMAKTLDFLRNMFTIVPVQILTALMALVSGYIAQLETNKRKKLSDQRAARKEMHDQRAKAELELRQLYDNNHGPLLKSAAKLSERLFTLVEGYSHWEEEEKPFSGTVYSAYLLAKYLAYVEHIKRSSQQTLDLGFPAADHIFLNILGRIQSTLGASDALLHYMQSSEASFKPAKGCAVHDGGPFAIVPRAQAAIGEIMLRRADSAGQIQHPKDAAKVLSFSEFAQLLENDKELRLWIVPVVRDFQRLRRSARAANLKSVRRGRWWQFWKKGDGRKGPQGRTYRATAPKYIGSRVFAIQNALQDLIDFLDPSPFKLVRPDYRRRLKLGDEHPLEQLRMPASLTVIYKQLANIRDHVIQPLRSNEKSEEIAIDVFVAAANRADGTLKKVGFSAVADREVGACPFSQRVLIVMRELDVKYNVIPVDMAHKPGWFHLLSGESRVPVIFSNGKLISGSRQILAYLVDKYPERAVKALGTSCHGPLEYGSMAFTRFVPKFLAAIAGDEKAKRELQGELRILNSSLEDYVSKCEAEMKKRAEKGQTVDRGHLLGGKRFNRIDTSLAPLLHSVDVGGTALSGQDCRIPEDCTAIRRYLTDARKHPSFSATCPSDEEIIYVWTKQAQGRALAKSVWLRDMLE